MEEFDSPEAIPAKKKSRKKALRADDTDDELVSDDLPLKVWNDRFNSSLNQASISITTANKGKAKMIRADSAQTTSFDPEEMRQLSDRQPDQYWKSMPHENSNNAMLLDMNEDHPLRLVEEANIRDRGMSNTYH